jgi:hypothetical protein
MVIMILRLTGILTLRGTLNGWSFGAIASIMHQDISPHFVIALKLAIAPGIFCCNFLYRKVSSVNAERAFSRGRLMINYLQSSQTLQAQMAIGYLVNTPYS